MKRVLLVNGLPASGKTSVSRHVTARHGWPLLALDRVKEPFFDEIGVGDREHNRALGRAAMAAIFGVIGDGPDGAVFVIDAWFGVVTRDRLDALIARAGVGALAEVWCQAPGAVLAERYRARADARHPGHPGADYAGELAARAATAAPLGLWPVLRVDTTRPLDGPALDAFVVALLAA